MCGIDPFEENEYVKGARVKASLFMDLDAQP